MRHSRRFQILIPALFVFVLLSVGTGLSSGQAIFEDHFEYEDEVTNHGWVYSPFGDPESIHTTTEKAYRGERSLIMDSIDDDEQRIRHFFDEPLTNIVITVHMFDDLGQDEGFNILAVGSGNITDAHNGFRSPTSVSYYSTATGTSSSWEPTDVPRTHGWHKLAYVVGEEGTDFYIDDALVRSEPQPTSIGWIQLLCGNHGYGPATGTVFFDEVKVRRGSGITVTMDIKPGSCPNPLNRKGGGVLPVALAGDIDLDTGDIDVSSVRLVGVAPLRHGWEDVTVPPVEEGESCPCTEESGDGYEDLTLKFDKKEVLEALGEVEKGEILILVVTGQLIDGTSFQGEDCVIIVN